MYIIHNQHPNNKNKELGPKKGHSNIITAIKLLYPIIIQPSSWFWASSVF